MTTLLNRLTRWLAGVTVLATVTWFALADEPAKSPIRGPLAGLPSAPGPHVAKIKALADNAWLHLGAPAADPKWGKARGRSWACKMPLAPELRGAFLFGEGVHGYAKPDGHYMDDLWFYDLNAHRWVCCYPGADTKTLDLKVNADGFEMTKDGEVLPVATQGHAYEMVTYDPHARRFMSMPCDAGYWRNVLKRRLEWLKDRPKAEVQASPWSFDVATGKWGRRVTETPSPPSSFGDVLLYVPSRKRAFFLHGGTHEVWFYDPAANRWTKASPKGPKPPWGIDPTECYDPKRERIYVGGGGYPVAPKGTNALWVYDLKADAWIDPRPKGVPCRGSNSYATQGAAMAYDSANDVVIVFRHGGARDEQGVFVYDPAANAWRDEPVSEMKAKAQCVNAFYDPELNAHFFHGAGDSRDDGTVWVYRYKKPEK